MFVVTKAKDRYHTQVVSKINEMAKTKRIGRKEKGEGGMKCVLTHT